MTSADKVERGRRVWLGLKVNKRQLKKVKHAKNKKNAAKFKKKIRVGKPHKNCTMVCLGMLNCKLKKKPNGQRVNYVAKTFKKAKWQLW